MRRMLFLLLVLLPAAAPAQQARLISLEPRLARIGYLMDRAGPGPLDTAFIEGLRDNGLVPGEGVELEVRFSGGRTDELPALAADLLAHGVALIVVQGTAATRAAMRASASVPIVMASSTDPVRDSLVQSLEHPGGNVTGRTLYAPDLAQRRLRLLREALPGVRKVAVLWDGTTGRLPTEFVDARAAAPGLGLELVRFDVLIPDALLVAFQLAAAEEVDAVLVLSDSAIEHRREIAQAALRARLPTMFAGRDWLTGGGLMSYGPDLADSFRLSAGHVARILAGAHPADLPVAPLMK